MTNDFSTHFSIQWKLTCRNLFDRGMQGHRLVPPLPGEMSDEGLCQLFSGVNEHNRDSIVFRDSQMQIEGIKLFCQCQDCCIAAAEVVLSRGSELVGMGAHSTSIMFDPNDANAVEFVTREKSLLEDEVEARKLRERQKDLEEKAELRAQITKLERRFADLVTETRGLIRDQKGQLWTRGELIAMSQQQQRED